MKSNHPGGYMGKLLRVDLTTEGIADETSGEATLRHYLGGTGIGMKYLCQEVSPKTQWDDPDNRLILASGPVGGTRINGSGSFSVVTKGPLTNGATSTQANGFFGAFLKFSGFDGIIIQGAAKRLLYLHIHDGTAEFRDANHLAGKDTWQTEELIKKELGKSEHEVSVFSIGPAGENLVKFACLVGDRGHVAAHNGLGAVMGSKRLKAIAVTRGKNRVEVADKERLSFLAKDLYEKITAPGTIGYRMSRFGTTGDIATCKGRLAAATLPVKNYTTSHFPKHIEFSREYIDPLFEIKQSPCWACRFDHCRILKVKAGPYAGYVGEEPEYEQWAHWGPAIGQKDVIKAFVLSNEVDRLGMDTNHVGWLISWLMECYEKELISKDNIDGIDLHWGNVEGTMLMLQKIAGRQGIGDILAKGILEAKEHFSPEIRRLAIYTQKGNTPRAHDHRACWRMILDTCISDTGTDEASSLSTTPSDVGLHGDADLFSPEVTAKLVAGTINRMPLDDSLVMCRFNNRGPGIDMEYLAEILKAVTGWDFTGEEASKVGYRVVNLLRAFNIRHGLSADLDFPSTRYGGAPIDGPFQGITIGPVYKETLENYYRMMGWDVKTGKPMPETLVRLGLRHVVSEIW
jgi:aldehyde:ferredoxin oxidoreductase